MGDSRCSGTLEIKHGEWRPVGSFGWTLKDAAVACRELDCGSAVSMKRSSNPKFLFSTNGNFNSYPAKTTDTLCEAFADHFRSKIDDIRSSLLAQQVLSTNTPGSLLLPETLESFVLVDARTLG